jgi:hypothetical protein
MKWYDDYDHIGYNRAGQKIPRRLPKRDQLDDFLFNQDPSKRSVAAFSIYIYCIMMMTSLFSSMRTNFLLFICGLLEFSLFFVRDSQTLDLVSVIYMYIYFFSLCLKWPDRWTIYDPVEDKEVELTPRDRQLLRNIQLSKFPDPEFDPYEVFASSSEIFLFCGAIHPLGGLELV